MLAAGAILTASFVMIERRSDAPLVPLGLLRSRSFTGANVVALAVCGAGVGLAMPAVVSVAVAAVPPERGGLASGLNNTARQIGNTLGVALLGGVVASADSVGTGVRTALLIVGACFLCAAVVAAATMAASGQPETAGARVRTGDRAP